MKNLYFYLNLINYYFFILIEIENHLKFFQYSVFYLIKFIL
jgi:hypothetical protein